MPPFLYNAFRFCRFVYHETDYQRYLSTTGKRNSRAQDEIGLCDVVKIGDTVEPFLDTANKRIRELELKNEELQALVDLKRDLKASPQIADQYDTRHAAHNEPIEGNSDACQSAPKVKGINKPAQTPATVSTNEELQALASLGLAKKRIAVLEAEASQTQAQLDAANRRIVQLELGNQQLRHDLADSTTHIDASKSAAERFQTRCGEQESQSDVSAVIVAQHPQDAPDNSTPTAISSTTATSTPATEIHDDAKRYQDNGEGAVVSAPSADIVAVPEPARRNTRRRRRSVTASAASDGSAMPFDKELDAVRKEMLVRQRVLKYTDPEVLELAFKKARKRGLFDNNENENEDVEVEVKVDSAEMPLEKGKVRYDSLTGVEEYPEEINVEMKHKRSRTGVAEVFGSENERQP